MRVGAVPHHARLSTLRSAGNSVFRTATVSAYEFASGSHCYYSNLFMMSQYARIRIIHFCCIINIAAKV